MDKLNSKKRIKIAIITNIPTPYRKKQWEYYSKCTYLDITVFYCANVEKGRHWNINSAEGIKEIFLKGLNFKSFHFNPGVLKIIFQDFDIFFVGGYGYPSLIIAIITLKILKKSWVMIIDGISPLNLNKEHFIIDDFKRFFIKGADAYSANGTVGKKFLKIYGILPEKIFNQYMTVDVDDFINKGKDSIEIKKRLREKYGIADNTTVIMYAGRLIYNKGVQDLIDAIKSLKIKGYNIVAFIVGEGDFKEELKMKSQDIKSNIIFTGHVNPEQIYKYYYASDIFVLPTCDDPWGLVVNEAMACGLPIIVTDAAGCSYDLVKDNGYIVTHHDINELSRAIEDLMDEKKRNEFGKNSRKIITKWTFRESLDSLIKILGNINSEN